MKILHSKMYEPDFTLGPNEFSWDSQVALTWMSNRSFSQLRNLSTFSFHFRNHTISRIFLIFFSSLWFLLFLICYNNFMMFLSLLYCRQKAFIWIWFILHATSFGLWDPSSSTDDTHKITNKENFKSVKVIALDSFSLQAWISWSWDKCKCVRARIFQVRTRCHCLQPLHLSTTLSFHSSIVFIVYFYQYL